jgi:hypothetical protein
MSKIFLFLQEFARLSPVEQRVFLFCLQKIPHPRKFTGDISFISRSSGIHRKSVERALKKISSSPILRRCVCYIQLDVIPEFYAQNALHSTQAGQFDGEGDFF